MLSVSAPAPVAALESPTVFRKREFRPRAVFLSPVARLKRRHAPPPYCRSDNLHPALGSPLLLWGRAQSRSAGVKCAGMRAAKVSASSDLLTVQLSVSFFDRYKNPTCLST